MTHSDLLRKDRNRVSTASTDTTPGLGTIVKKLTFYFWYRVILAYKRLTVWRRGERERFVQSEFIYPCYRLHPQSESHRTDMEESNPNQNDSGVDQQQSEAPVHLGSLATGASSADSTAMDQTAFTGWTFGSVANAAEPRTADNSTQISGSIGWTFTPSAGSTSQSSLGKRPEATTSSITLPPSKYINSRKPGRPPRNVFEDLAAEVLERYNEKGREKINAHIAASNENAVAAEKAFLNHTNHYVWDGQMGQYHFRVLRTTGEMSRLGYQWPHAFVGSEVQSVNAALWQVNHESKELKLVSLWTFSPRRDGTNQYYLRGAFLNDDIYGFYCEYHTLNITKAEDEHLEVSRGDDPVRNLYCPVLEALTLEEINV